jgi:hypothetical protein
VNGLVTSRDLLLHPLLILHGFGPRCFLRCVVAVISGRKSTFLDLVFPGDAAPKSRLRD